MSRTLSKAAGLAALRLGVLFARDDIADALRRAFTPYPVSNRRPGRRRSRSGGPAFSAALRARGAGEPGASRAWPERLGARVFPSGANFLLVDFGTGGSRLVRRLARRGILLRDRAGEFGRDGFVRITAGTLPQTRRLLRAIEEER